MSEQDQDVSKPQNGELNHHHDESEENPSDLVQDQKSAQDPEKKSNPDIDSKSDFKMVTYEAEILGNGAEVLTLADGSRIHIEEMAGKQKHPDTEDNTGTSEERRLIGADVDELAEVVDDLKRDDGRPSGDDFTEESSIRKFSESESYFCPRNCFRCCIVL